MKVIFWLKKNQNGMELLIIYKKILHNNFIVKSEVGKKMNQLHGKNCKTR